MTAILAGVTSANFDLLGAMAVIGNTGGDGIASAVQEFSAISELT